jgi:hypothetical protein
VNSFSTIGPGPDKSVISRFPRPYKNTIEPMARISGVEHAKALLHRVRHARLDAPALHGRVDA